MYLGEKFIERKVEGNKSIIINEFKEFEGDYLGVVQDINDCITDDWECLMDKYGIFFDRCDEWYSIDCDMAYEELSQHVTEEKNTYGSEEEYKEDCRIWEKELNLLKQAEGFTIYLQRKKSFYENQ